MVVVREVEVRRERVGEDALLARLPTDGAELARRRSRRPRRAGAAPLFAKLSVEAAGDAEPRAVLLQEEADVDREPRWMTRPGRSPKAVGLVIVELGCGNALAILGRSRRSFIALGRESLASMRGGARSRGRSLLCGGSGYFG